LIFGKRAFDYSNKSWTDIDLLLRHDNWHNNDIEKFVSFWSKRLWLTLDRMTERIDTVYSDVLIATNPSVNTIKKSLRIKLNRYPQKQINRISPLIHKFLVREHISTYNRLNHHEVFQKKLKKLGPVMTPWCHYLIDPRYFFPIDMYNHTAWKFITEMPEIEDIPMKVPQSFQYTPINGSRDYQPFRDWIFETLHNWKGDLYSVEDVVTLDRSLMSLGAFIQKNVSRSRT
jgi:hypothetical protein